MYLYTASSPHASDLLLLPVSRRWSPLVSR